MGLRAAANTGRYAPGADPVIPFGLVSARALGLQIQGIRQHLRRFYASLFAGSITGAMQANQVIYRRIFTVKFTFPVNFEDNQGNQSQCVAAIAATGSAVFSIEKNGTQIGTMSFAASGTIATFATTGGAVGFGPGDVLTIVAPATPDATLEGLAWCLVAQLPE